MQLREFNPRLAWGQKITRRFFFFFAIIGRHLRASLPTADDDNQSPQSLSPLQRAICNRSTAGPLNGPAGNAVQPSNREAKYALCLGTNSA